MQFQIKLEIGGNEAHNILPPEGKSEILITDDETKSFCLEGKSKLLSSKLTKTQKLGMTDRLKVLRASFNDTQK